MALPARARHRYTCRDDAAWPDQPRHELTHGDAVAMPPSPTARHQAVTGAVYRRLADLADARPGRPCRVFIAPLDVPPWTSCWTRPSWDATTPRTWSSQT